MTIQDFKNYLNDCKNNNEEERAKLFITAVVGTPWVNFDRLFENAWNKGTTFASKFYNSHIAGVPLLKDRLINSQIKVVYSYTLLDEDGKLLKLGISKALVKDIKLNQGMLQAVKYVKDNSDMSLMEAKAYVESLLW